MRLYFEDVKKELAREGWTPVIKPPMITVWMESSKPIVCWNGPDRRDIIEIDLAQAQVFSKYNGTAKAHQTLIVKADHNRAYIYTGVLNSDSTLASLPPYLKIEARTLMEMLPQPK